MTTAVCRMVLLAISIVVFFGQTSSTGWQEALAGYERQDYPTVLSELLPIAELGDARSQLLVGEMYRDGMGTPQNYQEALHWYRRSAQQGLPEAQESLGVMYLAGKGVLQDNVEGLKWVTSAANSGLPSSQLRLGLAYQNGLGVIQNYTLSHMWYNLAAAAGSKQAALLREHLAQQMTPAQIAEAQRLAREWSPSAR